MKQFRRKINSIYSEEEERVLFPGQSIRQFFLAPIAAVLARLGVTPDMLSFSSVVFGIDRGEEELANALPGDQDALLFLAVNAVDFASELLHGDPPSTPHYVMIMLKLIPIQVGFPCP